VGSLLLLLAPDVVVHTAYLQEGPDAEVVNVGGSEAVARAAAAVGARLVHLSSDAIFRGDLGRPLREEDPPDPVTAYGKTKARAEEVVRARHPAAVLVRTSLLYGGPGHAPSKHEEVALAAARGESEMGFFTNEIRSPVQVGDLARAVLELTRMDVSGPLHVAGSDPLSRHAFAQLVAASRGADSEVVGTAVAGPGRPRDCPLDSGRARSLLATRLRGAREVLGAAPNTG
jgi:dTDP-4-dehydrorhamnose reductase